MTLLILLVTFALAQDPPQSQQQTKAKLAQILATLERIHPEAAHSECERACHAALMEPEKKGALGFVECIKAARDHGVQSEDTAILIDATRKRFPDAMAKRTDAYWRTQFDAALAVHQAKRGEVGPRPLP